MSQQTAPSAPPTVTAGENRATTFQSPTSSALDRETVPGGNLLVAAYAIAWLVVLIVVVRVFRRQNELAGKIALLEDAVRKAPSQRARE